MQSITNDYPDSMMITWELSNVCNYSCTYCNPDLYGGTSGHPDLDTALSFFNYITSNINPNPKLLSLTGGEPTLWPKLPDFLAEIDDSYATEIVTNGSRTVKWWNRLFKSSKVDRVSLSVHLEFANIDHILDVCEAIQDETLVTVMILFDTKYFDKAKEITDRISERELRISARIKPITLKNNQSGKSNYTSDQAEYIKSYTYSNLKNPPKLPIASRFIVDGKVETVHWANNLIAKNEHQFNGWWCEVGKKRLYIDHRGIVYGATCGTTRNNPIGNLHENWVEKIEGMYCDSIFCTCPPDIRIPKQSKGKIV